MNQQPRDGLFLNEDCNHFAYTRPADEMTPVGVDALVDSYADGTQVSDLVFNPNAMRSSVESAVKQAFWDGFDPDAGDHQPFFSGVTESHDVIRKWVSNLKLLHDRGIDPFARWLQRSKEVGVRGWISVRMNDLHQVDDPGHCMHDRFWQQHPEYWRMPGKIYEWAADRALDYEHAEVRAHHLEYIRECVERWDMDGLEIDWMRQPWCFRPGHEEEGAILLTELMQQVRAMTDARAEQVGHPVKLAVRVPTQPDVSRRMGFDAVHWARAGLIDLVIPTPVFGSTEFDIPLEIWRQLLDGTGARMAPGLEISTAPFPFFPYRYNSPEQVRGAASTLLDRGADQIYLFNYMDRDHMSEEVTKLPHLLRELASPPTLQGKARSHVYTYQNLWAPGTPVASSLPYQCSHYGFRPTAEFRVPVGALPYATQASSIRLGLEVSDAEAHQGHEVLAYGGKIRFKFPPVDDDVASQLIVCLNSNACGFASNLGERIDECGATHQYKVPDGAIRRGDNIIEIFNPAETAVSITWVEIFIDDAETDIEKP